MFSIKDLLYGLLGGMLHRTCSDLTFLLGLELDTHSIKQR